MYERTCCINGPRNLLNNNHTTDVNYVMVHSLRAWNRCTAVKINQGEPYATGRSFTGSSLVFVSSTITLGEKHSKIASKMGTETWLNESV